MENERCQGILFQFDDFKQAIGFKFKVTISQDIPLANLNICAKFG